MCTFSAKLAFDTPEHVNIINKHPVRMLNMLAKILYSKDSHYGDVVDQLFCSILIPGISVFFYPLSRMTLRATSIIKGLGSARRITIPDGAVTVCLDADIQLQEVTCCTTSSQFQLQPSSLASYWLFSNIKDGEHNAEYLLTEHYWSVIFVCMLSLSTSF